MSVSNMFHVSNRGDQKKYLFLNIFLQQPLTAGINCRQWPIHSFLELTSNAEIKK